MKILDKVAIGSLSVEAGMITTFVGNGFRFEHAEVGLVTLVGQVIYVLFRTGGSVRIPVSDGKISGPVRGQSSTRR